jgi:SOS-response transcriptional repressor LexA
MKTMPRRPDPATTQRVLKVVRSNPGATYREIGRLLGLRSPSVVAYHIKKLQAAGTILRGPARSHRTTRPINSPETCAKKAAGGRKGKGVDALTLKKDPDLQKLIEGVVAKAKAKEAAGETMNSTDIFRAHSVTLRVIRVG